MARQVTVLNNNASANHFYALPSFNWFSNLMQFFLSDEFVVNRVVFIIKF